MSVRRGPRKADQFTILDNAALCDDRLSFRARGILAYILSKPADWRTSSESLARAAKEGRDAIRTALRELREFGYMVTEKIQDGQTGQWSTISTVYELPVDADQSPVPPRPGKQASGKPDLGKAGATQRNALQRTETNHHQTSSPKPAPAAVREEPVVVVPRSDEELTSLAQACRDKGLPASWDTLSREKAQAITDLVEIHGVDALAAHALKMHTPGNPTKHAGGLLNFWRSMPIPRAARPAAKDCDRCENGWYGADYDQPCPSCRPNLARVAA
ncbi:helix-turn-helix domain-containing protein [Rhodococcus tibetensis]|uniref:Helix-turn-helix domain-containing protein n=1 Tax=Rhodococcus tibetensis TaxID=2965064 RepID=A0ABT1QCE1_9NOCA|nr:helix-turn-helix domain-containing protein [Rhodococcus sp. FXJ9.536]MCQ4119911.1 helix-turn-helix domain-containing protein [Rhodococcus sp. FXJ9.536]